MQRTQIQWRRERAIEDMSSTKHPGSKSPYGGPGQPRKKPRVKRHHKMWFNAKLRSGFVRNQEK